MRRDNAAKASQYRPQLRRTVTSRHHRSGPNAFRGDDLEKIGNYHTLD
jgi:hypothetical protein